MKCDNRCTDAYCVIRPQCFDGDATRRVTVVYSPVEADTLFLCADCARALAADARRHGYRVSNRKLG